MRMLDLSVALYNRFLFIYFNIGIYYYLKSILNVMAVTHK